MNAQTLTGTAAFAEFVVVCDECRREVQTFTLNACGKCSNRPCGHLSSVTLVPNPRISGDAAA